MNILHLEKIFLKDNTLPKEIILLVARFHFDPIKCSERLGKRSRFGVQALLRRTASETTRSHTPGKAAEAVPGPVVTWPYCCMWASAGPKIHLSDRPQRRISGAKHPKEEFSKYYLPGLHQDATPQGCAPTAVPLGGGGCPERGATPALTGHIPTALWDLSPMG